MELVFEHHVISGSAQNSVFLAWKNTPHLSATALYRERDMRR